MDRNIGQASASEERVSVLHILLLVLSIYALGAIFVQTAFRLPPNIDDLLDLLDDFVCAVFFIDFSVRFFRAPSKRNFLKWGWIDLISCIPKIAIFRYGRMLRVIRVLRMLRAFRSAKVLVQAIFRNRAKSSAASVIAIAIVLAMFASIAILNFETAPESNIKTPSDALWWAATTITTVGYGDKYPVTFEGRIVAFFLIVTGVGLFGTLTGYIASLFVECDDREDKKIDQLTAEIRSLRELIENSGFQKKGYETMDDSYCKEAPERDLVT
ncbi:MAG: ion transporter [Verrucomicrobia bacterium]|nr:ion transporter [Verrucomicrobiota bacterium]